MHRQIRGLPPHLPQDAGISNDDPVNAKMREPIKIRGKVLQIGRVGKDVQRHIDPYPGPVGQRHCLGQFLFTEVARPGPQPKTLPCQIDRISAIADGHLQFVRPAHWDQEFRESAWLLLLCVHEI